MHSYRNYDPRPPIMQGSPPPERMRVPIEDWDRPPWNRWSFQHVREILPTVEVWRGAGPVRRLPRQEQDLDSLSVSPTGSERSTVGSFLDQSYTDGFLIIHDGAIVHERYFNGMDERTLHLSQSMAKSVTAAAAGALIGHGLLDREQLVTHYLPELEATAYKGSRLKHVLDMTSGVRYSEEYTDPYSDVGQTDVACGWKPIPAGGDGRFRWPRHMWEQIMGMTTAERRHGEKFVYRSIETDVLAFCMERATGKRLPAIVSAEVWQKLGQEESACFTVDRAGYALANGGFNATLRDYGRFGLLLLDGGMVDGHRIVSEEWIELTRSGDHSIFGEPYTTTLPHGAYRNQYWIEEPRSRSLLCRGVFGQLIYVSWDYAMVAVKLSSWPTFLDDRLSIATLGVLHTIGKHLNS
jgi:CubicO group peptidase (beta-lactamase class C family)